MYHWLYFPNKLVFIFSEDRFCLAYSVDFDKKTHFAAFHLGLDCQSMHLGVTFFV